VAELHAIALKSIDKNLFLPRKLINNNFR